MEDKINEIVSKIEALPAGSEFRMDDFFKEYGFDTATKFDLVNEVYKACKAKGITIENTGNEKALVGLPWTYLIRKTN